MKIRPHIADLVEPSVDDFRTYEFDNLEELLAIDFVKSFTKSKNQRFYQFSLLETSAVNQDVLIAEFNMGNTWYIVGYLNGNSASLALQKWGSR